MPFTSHTPRTRPTDGNKDVLGQWGTGRTRMAGAKAGGAGTPGPTPPASPASPTPSSASVSAKGARWPGARATRIAAATPGRRHSTGHTASMGTIILPRGGKVPHPTQVPGDTNTSLDGNGNTGCRVTRASSALVLHQPACTRTGRRTRRLHLPQDRGTRLGPGHGCRHLGRFGGTHGLGCRGGRHVLAAPVP